MSSELRVALRTEVRVLEDVIKGLQSRKDAVDALLLMCLPEAPMTSPAPAPTPPPKVLAPPTVVSAPAAVPVSVDADKAAGTCGEWMQICIETYGSQPFTAAQLHAETAKLVPCHVSTVRNILRVMAENGSLHAVRKGVGYLYNRPPEAAAAVSVPPQEPAPPAVSGGREQDMPAAAAVVPPARAPFPAKPAPVASGRRLTEIQDAVLTFGSEEFTRNSLLDKLRAAGSDIDKAVLYQTLRRLVLSGGLAVVRKSPKPIVYKAGDLMALTDDLPAEPEAVPAVMPGTGLFADAS